MAISGEYVLNNIIVSLIERKIETIEVSKIMDIFEEIRSNLKARGIIINLDCSIYNVFNNFGTKIKFCDEMLFNYYCYSGNEDADLGINKINQNSNLLKNFYPKEQLDLLISNLNFISKKIGEEELEKQTLPKLKRYYQCGLPIDIIDVTDEVLDKEKGYQYKKEN